MEAQRELTASGMNGLRALFERSAEAMLLIADGRFVACNAAAAELLGYPDRGALLRRRPADISPALQPDGQPSAEKQGALIAAALERGSLRFPWHHLRADGSVVPVEVLLTALPFPGRPLLHVAWHDIGAVASAAADAERARLGRELHDSVSQTLSAASMIADVVPRLWARDPELGAQRLAEVRALTHGALAEMRALLLALRPDALVELPFATMLHQLAEAVGAQSAAPITVRVEPPGAEQRLAPELQVAMYHIVQEALHNAAHHACATQISVTGRLALSSPGRPEAQPHRPAVVAASVSICDDGVGFEPGHHAPGHLGLQTMRERASAAGISLELVTAPGAGTQITLVWPAPPAPAHTPDEVLDA